MTLSARERDPKVRALALVHRGSRCEICRFDFAERYGEFAKHCLEIHHLKQFAFAGRRGMTTTLQDVLVVCPKLSSCFASIPRSQ